MFHYNFSFRGDWSFYFIIWMFPIWLPVSSSSFVCYECCKHDILKKNEPILLQIGKGGQRGKEMKWSTFGVSGSKVIIIIIIVVVGF